MPAPETAESLHQAHAPGIVVTPSIPPEVLRQVQVPIHQDTHQAPQPSQQPGSEKE